MCQHSWCELRRAEEEQPLWPCYSPRAHTLWVGSTASFGTVLWSDLSKFLESSEMLASPSLHVSLLGPLAHFALWHTGIPDFSFGITKEASVTPIPVLIKSTLHGHYEGLPVARVASEALDQVYIRFCIPQLQAQGSEFQGINSVGFVVHAGILRLSSQTKIFKMCLQF